MEEKFKYYELKRVHDKKVLIVTFNRAPVNALTQKCYEELIDIMNIVQNDECICSVVLQSGNRLFSAGADVNNLKNDTEILATIRKDFLRKAIKCLYECPVPLICAVNGGAVGAGAIFAACGDIVLASEDAFFSLPEINIGIVGGAKGLSRFLPQQKVRAMVLTGMKVPAEEAYRLGGVEEVVEKEGLTDKALDYAKAIADKGYYASRKWKESLILTERLGPLEGFYVEQTLSQELTTLRE